MPSTEYFDAEIYLTGRDQARLSVWGDRDYEGWTAFDEDLYRRLRTEELHPKAYGTLLFQALFHDEELRRGYRSNRDHDKALRLRLYIARTAPQDLHTLHWERLHDPEDNIALACHPHTPLSRYLKPKPWKPPPRVERPRVLVVISAPSDQAKYRLPEICRRQSRDAFATALESLAGSVDWEALEGPATPERVHRRLLDGRFQALHVLAHGSGQPQPALFLENDDGTAFPVDVERFAGILDGERELRLVTLLACHSGQVTETCYGLAPELVRRSVPAVVAMRRQISVATAATFTRHLYEHLFRTGQVDVAVNQARHHLRLAAGGDRSWDVPVLFSRLRDGLLWERPDVWDSLPDGRLIRRWLKREVRKSLDLDPDLSERERDDEEQAVLSGIAKRLEDLPPGYEPRREDLGMISFEALTGRERQRTPQGPPGQEDCLAGLEPAERRAVMLDRCGYGLWQVNRFLRRSAFAAWKTYLELRRGRRQLRACLSEEDALPES